MQKIDFSVLEKAVRRYIYVHIFYLKFDIFVIQ